MPLLNHGVGVVTLPYGIEAARAAPSPQVHLEAHKRSRLNCYFDSIRGTLSPESIEMSGVTRTDATLLSQGIAATS